MGTASSAACSPHLPGGRCLELTEERVPPGPGDEEGAPTPHGPLGVLLRHDHLLRGRPAPNTTSSATTAQSLRRDDES
jgi:hypothetical protein